MIKDYEEKRDKTRSELLNILKLGYKILYIDDKKNLFLYKQEEEIS